MEYDRLLDIMAAGRTVKTPSGSFFMTDAQRTRTQAKIDRYDMWYGSNIEGPNWFDEEYDIGISIPCGSAPSVRRMDIGCFSM